MQEYMTEKQKQVLWKKRRLVELKRSGLSHTKVHKQLNEELKEMGWKEVSLNYVRVYWNMLKNQM